MGIVPETVPENVERVKRMEEVERVAEEPGDLDRPVDEPSRK
jgi:hypothetical protein